MRSIIVAIRVLAAACSGQGLGSATSPTEAAVPLKRRPMKATVGPP
jgi:hypothetical protein